MNIIQRYTYDEHELVVMYTYVGDEIVKIAEVPHILSVSDAFVMPHISVTKETLKKMKEKLIFGL